MLKTVRPDSHYPRTLDLLHNKKRPLQLVINALINAQIPAEAACDKVEAAGEPHQNKAEDAYKNTDSLGLAVKLAEESDIHHLQEKKSGNGKGQHDMKSRPWRRVIPRSCDKTYAEIGNEYKKRDVEITGDLMETLQALKSGRGCAPAKGLNMAYMAAAAIMNRSRDKRDFRKKIVMG